MVAGSHTGLVAVNPVERHFVAAFVRLFKYADHIDQSVGFTSKTTYSTSNEHVTASINGAGKWKVRTSTSQAEGYMDGLFAQVHQIVNDRKLRKVTAWLNT